MESSESVEREWPIDTPFSTEVVPVSEYEIGAAIVFLKARARRFGDSAFPLAVRLANGGYAGWRSAALSWIDHNKKSENDLGARLGGVTTGIGYSPPDARDD